MVKKLLWDCYVGVAGNVGLCFLFFLFFLVCFYIGVWGVVFFVWSVVYVIGCFTLIVFL